MHVCTLAASVGLESLHGWVRHCSEWFILEENRWQGVQEGASVGPVFLLSKHINAVTVARRLEEHSVVSRTRSR